MSPAPHTKLGFNFYGRGNTGDDMMLAGFLKVWPESRPLFSVVSRAQCAVLRRRFPQVRWIPEGGDAPDYALWLGVGDTPVQVLCGLFFLEYLERELAAAKAAGSKVAFVGVGAEREAVRERSRFSRVLESVDLISTRDDATREILVRDFAVNPATIRTGEDLAHIYLEEAMATRWTLTDRALDVAVNHYAEGMGRRDSLTVLQWLQRQQRLSRTVAYLSNEARLLGGLEARRYAELAWVTCLGRQGEAVGILSPNRWAADLDDMIAHFPTIQTVISSRYHCILSAAWAGCRTFGLRRSSKVESLCEELQIEHSTDAVSRRTLDRGLEHAWRVPLTVLHAKAERSRQAALQLLEQVIPAETHTQGLRR